MPRRQMLCLSGGGYAGLFAAKLLAELERQNPKVPIGQRFDAFAGTSVGGLIALALAAGNKASKILEVMQRVGTNVFPSLWTPDLLAMLWGPKYAVAPLRQHVLELMSTKTLGSLDRPVLITSVSLATAQPRLFRSPVHQHFHSDKKISLVDVALATSAAPTYFPPHPIGNDLYADGGVVANCPDHLAILDALNMYGWAANDLHVLSIGTTHTPAGLLTHSVKNWGLRKWLQRKRILGVAMSAQMALAQDVAKQLLLPGRHVRIDPALSVEQADAIGLDKAAENATKTIQGLAESELARIPALTLKQLTVHQSAPP